MITIDNIIKETRKVAAENPDYVYPNKRGTYVGCPCIFGVVLSNLFPDKDLSEYDKPLGTTIDSVLQDILGENLDKQKVRWCSYVQEYQDDEISWGQCVINADKKVKI